jgi:hypothetical protein
MTQVVGCTAVSEPIPVLGPTPLLRAVTGKAGGRSAGPDPGEEDVGRAVLIVTWALALSTLVLLHDYRCEGFPASLGIGVVGAKACVANG